jgi:hypothetical protein
MAFGIIYEFEGVTEAHYDAVNQKLGLDRGGAGDWPAGIRTHAAGPTEQGWCVFEVWDDEGAQQQWLSGRLGAALGAVGVPEPVRVTTIDLVAFETPA